MADHEVVVIGAGPYGLSVASHLRHAGVDVHVFGESMGFWRHDMPNRMLLRSAVRSSSISGPVPGLMLRDFWRETGSPGSDPVTREDFVNYGEWFRARTIGEPDFRRVTNVEADRGAMMQVSLEDGTVLSARRVVVAAGIRGFAHVPDSFGSMDGATSHTSEHSTFSQFAGKRVMVVGSGQSALESAALLNESGAEVEVVARAERVFWLPDPVELTSARKLWQSATAPPTDVCPPGWAWLAAAPDLLRFTPRRFMGEMNQRCLRRAGAHWLRGRLGDITLTLGTTIVSLSRRADWLDVSLSDGTARDIDHLMLGTGYRVDVSRYQFVSGSLARLERENGYPALSAGFESSVPGLHFVGAAAAGTFGPITRFVVGTSYAGPALAAHVRGVRRPLPRLAMYPSNGGARLPNQPVADHAVKQHVRN